MHISAELSGTFESAQLAAAGRSRCTPVDSRQVGHGHRLRRAGRGGRVDGGADAPPRREAARDAGRGDHVAVLRRHPGVPAPRRPDGGRGRPARLGPGGQADPEGRGRPDRPVREGAHLGARRCAGWRSSRSRRPATPRWTSRVAHLASPDRAEQLAERLATGSRTGSASARSGAARSARCSAPTSGRAWSRWRVAAPLTG